MRNLKRPLVILFSLVLAIFIFTSCDEGSEEEDNSSLMLLLFSASSSSNSETCIWDSGVWGTNTWGP